jgi:hypothetical protein
LSATPLGLLRVEYEVPAGTAMGSYALTFNQDNPNTDPFSDYVDTTSNSDMDNSFSPGAVVDGAIVVTPEPGSVVLLLLGAIGLFFAARRRRG